MRVARFLVSGFVFASIFSNSLLAVTSAYVATNNNDVNVIDTSTEAVVAVTSVQPGPACIAVTPDGAKVFISNFTPPGSLSIIDAATNLNTPSSPIFFAPGDSSIFVAVNTAGTFAYVVNYINSMPGNVAVVDVASETQVGAAIPVGIEPQMIAITPDGSYGYVPNYNNAALTSTVSVIRTSDNTALAPIPVERRPIHLAITPNGAKVYVANYGSGSVSVIDTATQMNTGLSPISSGIGNGPQFIAITPDGSKALVANYIDDNVSVIDTATDTVSVVIPVGNLPFYIAISSDGQRAYVANSGSADVSIIDLGSLSVIGTPMVGTGPVNLAITPDLAHVYVANQGLFSMNISIIDAATFNVVNVPVSGSSNWIAITPGQFLNLSGYQVKNEFLIQTDLVNVINWTAPGNGDLIVQYQIFRNAALTDLAGTVSASGPLQFQDHGRRKNKIYTYYVVSVTGNGTKSIPSVITIP